MDPALARLRTLLAGTQAPGSTPTSGAATLAAGKAATDASPAVAVRAKAGREDAAATAAPLGTAPAAAQGPQGSAASGRPGQSPSVLLSALRDAVKPLLPVAPGQTVQLKVKAGDLGEISLSLREEGGTLVARMEGANPLAQQALKDAAPQLAAAFREEGQPLARLELGGQDPGRSATDQGRQSGGRTDQQASQERPTKEAGPEALYDPQEVS
jgi:hypothetical protein